MAKALEGFHARGASGYVFYGVGDDVPDDVARKVNPDLIDGDVDQEESGPVVDGEAFDAAVEAEVAKQVEAAKAEAVEEHKAREQAAYDALASQDESYDPSAEGVKAADVKAYLEGLDRETVNGQAEYDRVVELEQQGANRSSAIPAD